MAEFAKPLDLEKVWASAGTKTPNPDATKIANGWVVEIPPREYFNYIEYKQDQMLAHINQHGISSWDTNASYIAAKSYVQGSNGIVYVSRTTHSGVDPVGESGASTAAGGVNWKLAFYFASDQYTRTETDNKYLAKTSNLSDLPNIGTARTNISVYSKAETDQYYCSKTSNLADVINTTSAFNNIKQPATESYVGALQIATDTEAVSGTDNTKALTPQKLKLGVSYTVGNPGHIKLPSWLGGITFMWGTQTLTANEAASASKSSTFNNAALCAVISPASSSGSDIACPHIYTSGTNVVLKSTDNNTYSYNWMAIGY